MRNCERSRTFGLFLVIAATVLVLVALVACGAPKPTPTPAQSAPPTPTRVAPASTATPTAAPAAPTPTPAPQVGAKPQYGGTLRFATRNEIDTLDPNYSALSGTYTVFYALYNQLFQIDKDGNLLPSLAQSWDISADGKTITLRLQKGVKFHDGTDFRSQVVKWNFDRMMDPNDVSPRRGEIQPYLERVEVVDDGTLRLLMYNPFRPLLPLLATERIGWMSSPAAVEKEGKSYGRNPVGTGPYRFVEWALGDHVLIKRNDSYWEKDKPYLDGVLIQMTGEPSVRLAMLRTGETDIAYNTDIRAEDMPTVERNPALKSVRYEGSATNMLQSNPSKPPFNNKALRQAISYSIDRDKFVQVVLGGAGTPAYTMIATGWAYNPNLRPIVFDPTKAKEKLVEAGYPRGVTIPMGCPTTGIHLQVCETTQAMMKEVGINAAIELIETSGYFTMGDAGYFNRVGLGSIQWAHRIDPHTSLQGLFHTKGFSNVKGYSNPEVNQLIDEAAAIYDTAKVKPIYDRIQTNVAEDASAVFLARRDSFYAMNKRIQGFVVYPTKFEHLEFLWLQK